MPKSILPAAKARSARTARQVRCHVSLRATDDIPVDEALREKGTLGVGRVRRGSRSRSSMAACPVGNRQVVVDPTYWKRSGRQKWARNLQQTRTPERAECDIDTLHEDRGQPQRETP